MPNTIESLQRFKNEAEHDEQRARSRGDATSAEYYAGKSFAYVVALALLSPADVDPQPAVTGVSGR